MFRSFGLRDISAAEPGRNGTYGEQRAGVAAVEGNRESKTDKYGTVCDGRNGATGGCSGVGAHCESGRRGSAMELGQADLRSGDGETDLQPVWAFGEHNLFHIRVAEGPGGNGKSTDRETGQSYSGVCAEWRDGASADRSGWRTVYRRRRTGEGLPESARTDGRT